MYIYEDNSYVVVNVIIFKEHLMDNDVIITIKDITTTAMCGNCNTPIANLASELPMVTINKLLNKALAKMYNRKCKVRALDGLTVLAEIITDKEIYRQDVYDVQLTELIAFDKLLSMNGLIGCEARILRETWFHNIPVPEMLTNSIWKLQTECTFAKATIVIADMKQLLKVGLMVRELTKKPYLEGRFQ